MRIFISAGEASGDLHAAAPVSYTHLDVYKRQHIPINPNGKQEEKQPHKGWNKKSQEGRFT